jgi:hypothetical protein
MIDPKVVKITSRYNALFSLSTMKEGKAIPIEKLWCPSGFPNLSQLASFYGFSRHSYALVTRINSFSFPIDLSG